MDPSFVEPDRPLPVFEIEGSFRRVAVLSDVHGNVPAFTACLADVARENVDAIVFLGDLTWGPQPSETLALARSLDWPAWFVRGNSERAVIEFADGTRVGDYPNDEWMVAAHGPDGVAAVSGFARALCLSVDGFGDIRLCHGSPRSDIELLTPSTPAERIERATVGVAETIVGHGHTHVQYQRLVGKRTVFGPGSVGIPYGTEGQPGARWVLLTTGIDLRVSPYDIEESIAIARSIEYPGLSKYEKYLRTPPSLDDIVLDAERLEFSD